MLAASSEPVFSSFTATAAPLCVNAQTFPKKPLPSPPSPSTGLRSARLRPSANNKSNAGTRNLASTTTAAGGAHERPSGHTCRRTNKYGKTSHEQSEHHSQKAQCCWQAGEEPKRTQTCGSHDRGNVSRCQRGTLRRPTRAVLAARTRAHTHIQGQTGEHRQGTRPCTGCLRCSMP